MISYKGLSGCLGPSIVHDGGGLSRVGLVTIWGLTIGELLCMVYRPNPGHFPPNKPMTNTPPRRLWEPTPDGWASRPWTLQELEKYCELLGFDLTLAKKVCDWEVSHDA